MKKRRPRIRTAPTRRPSGGDRKHCLKNCSCVLQWAMKKTFITEPRDRHEIGAKMKIRSFVMVVSRPNRAGSLAQDCR